MELIPSLPNDIAHECLIRVPYKKFSTMATVCKSWKEDVHSSEFHERRRKARGSTRSIVVLTNARHFKWPILFVLYEPATGVWSNIPPIPGFPKGPQQFHKCLGVGQNFVVVGGLEDGGNQEISNTVFIYNLVSGTWRRGADMPGESRSYFACASDSDRMVFVAGGLTKKTRNWLRSAMAYDVFDDKWISLPNMSIERYNCEGIFHLGKFHVIGGNDFGIRATFMVDEKKRNTEDYCLFEDWQGGDIMKGTMKRTSRDVLDLATGQWSLIIKEGQGIPKMNTYLRRIYCVVDEWKMYKCMRGYIAVHEGGTWRKVAKIPNEIHWTADIMTWQGNLLVSGDSYFNPGRSIYTLDLKSYKWTKVDLPGDFHHFDQMKACLEICG